MDSFTALDPNATVAERLADIDAAIHSARTLQWNASQMNNARGVFAAERILDGLYAERDAITGR